MKTKVKQLQSRGAVLAYLWFILTCFDFSPCTPARSHLLIFASVTSCDIAFRSEHFIIRVQLGD